MKNYLTILALLFTICGFSQITGDIERDTALANQYYEELNGTTHEFHRTERALTIIQEAVSLYEAHPFHVELIKIKSSLSHILRDHGKYERAEEAALSTITLGKEHLETYPIHPNLKMSYFTMYSVSQQKENTERAIEFIELAMACTDKMSGDYFKMGNSLAQLYEEVQNFKALDKLLNGLEEIIDSEKDGKLDKHGPVVYINKAALYANIGLNEQVIAYGQKFEAENEKHKTYEPDSIFSIYHEVSTAYQNIGNFDESLKWLDKCLRTAKNNNDLFSISLTYGEIGYTYYASDKYSEAVVAFEKSIEYKLIDKELDAENLSAQYINLASAFIKLDELDKAEEALKKALSYDNQSSSHRVLSIIYNKKGNEDAALEEIQKALITEFPQFQPKNITENPLPFIMFNSRVARVYAFDKTKLLFSIGLREKDEAKLQSSIDLLKMILGGEELDWQKAKGFEQSRFSTNKTLVGIIDRIILQYYATHEQMPSDEIHAELFEMMEKRKAIQLIETLSPSHLPKELYEQEKELVKAIQISTYKLDLAIIGNNADSITYHRNNLIQANDAMADYLKYIANNYPKESNHFYHQDFKVSKGVQENISDKALFIEYAVSHKGTYISTISQSKGKIFKVDVEAIDIQKNIQLLNELIQDRFAFQTAVRNEFIDVSHELYKTLIQPIESELEGKTKLMLVLEGQLFHIPFELLLKTNEKKPYHELDFLVKDYEVNYHYSATAFLKLKEKTTVKDNSLLAFAPVFSKGDELSEAIRSLDFMVDSLYKGIDDNEFVALPNTKKEVNKIAKIIQSNKGQTNVLLNKNATKNNLSQQLNNQSYQFIHIATHGLVNYKNPKLSALACYSENEKMDNLIYANEIQFKDINADLVVLSSCESGIGQLVAGEGLIALNRSFIYSGAKNILFSLWKVNDKYSSELMIDFYDNYFQNQSYTAALRNAKLKLLANPKTAQPKFWAPFVLMGE